jgi:hypothetical protein
VFYYHRQLFSKASSLVKKINPKPKACVKKDFAAAQVKKKPKPKACVKTLRLCRATLCEKQLFRDFR